MRVNRFIRLLIYLMGLYTCIDCQPPRDFKTWNGRDKHKKSIHDGVRVSCIHGCGKTFTQETPSKNHHERTCDENPNGVTVGRGLPQQFYRDTNRTQKMVKVSTAHDDNYSLYHKCLNSDKKNILKQLHRAIINDCRGVAQCERDNIKFYIVGSFVFEKASRSGVLTDPPIYLKTKPISTTRSKPIEEALEECYKDLVEQIDSFTKNGSVFVLKAILNVDVRVLKYNPMRASRYLRLSKKLRNSRHILNIHNDDTKCALYCIGSGGAYITFSCHS